MENSFVCTNVKIVGNYTNESQFFFIFFFVRGYVCACGGTYVRAGVLFNCMLSHVGTERERRTCNEGLCTGVMRMVVLIYLKLDIFVYTSV